MFRELLNKVVGTVLTLNTDNFIRFRTLERQSTIKEIKRPFSLENVFIVA